MNAVIGTLAQAPVPRLQVRSLCADWSVGAEKLYQLLFVMESVGVVRESGRRLEACPDERAGDFVVDGTLTVEIGGSSKERRGADFVIRDNIDAAAGKTLPLWCLGFLY